MKKVSAKMFFTVMWRGLCQVLGWFFGLFGYKREGTFAKCVWGLFSLSAAILMGLLALVVVTSLCETVYEKRYKKAHCYNPDCGHSEYMGTNIYYHNLGDGKGYVFNSQTEEKIIKDIKWIARPEGEDSLVCFSDGKKRGYFNKNTGKVVIPAKYGHAWIFSEGLASVEENGSIKFIDTQGETVIDRVTTYVPGMSGLFFRNGYCVVDNDGPELCCLIDKSGKMVLPQEYNSIAYNGEYGVWRVRKGEEMAVLDKDLKPIIPMMACSLFIDEGTIDMTMPDHTMRKYDLQGRLMNDFYVYSVQKLEYEKDEICYRDNTVRKVDDEIVEELEETYHPKATARLRMYAAGNDYRGLMTAEGHRVTIPLYTEIEAIGYDLYLCTTTNYDKLVVNGKGEIMQ